MNDDVNGRTHVAMIDLCSSRCGFKHESNVMSTVKYTHTARRSCQRRHSDKIITTERAR